MTVRLNDVEYDALRNLADSYGEGFAFILRRGLVLVQEAVDHGQHLRGELHPPDGDG